MVNPAKWQRLISSFKTFIKVVCKNMDLNIQKRTPRIFIRLSCSYFWGEVRAFLLIMY